MVNAQNKDLIREEYTKLKSKQTLVPGKGLAEPGPIVLVETQKLSGGTAKVSFIIDGKLSQQDIQIQPVQIVRDTNGHVLRTENAGELTSIRVRNPKDQGSKQTVADPEVIIAISSDANAGE